MKFVRLQPWAKGYNENIVFDEFGCITVFNESSMRLLCALVAIKFVVQLFMLIQITNDERFSTMNLNMEVLKCSFELPFAFES